MIIKARAGKIDSFLVTRPETCFSHVIEMEPEITRTDLNPNLSKSDQPEIDPLIYYSMIPDLQRP